VIANGLVLDKAGNKMSKRLGNVVDPFKTIDQYGADAPRWYMMSNSDPWDNLKFDIEGVAESQRKFFGTLYNTYSFFAIYANIDQFVFDRGKMVPYAERPELDRWILSRLNNLVELVRTRMDDYDATPAVRAIEEFVGDHLSNWYVRLSRRRFWKTTPGEERDKQAAYETLYECLLTVSQLMSPFAPFFSDWLYRNLGGTAESVHLTDWPEAAASLQDAILEGQMEYAQKITSLVLSIRKKENIKVRQPLQKILIPVVDSSVRDQIEHVKDIVLTEVNVKELEYMEAIEKTVKPNFRVLGKKVGAKMKQVAEAISQLNAADVHTFETTGTLVLNVEGEDIPLTAGDLDILSTDIPGYKVANEGKVTVALDITLNDELREEGIARELVSRLQNLRKELDFQVTDRIRVRIEEHSYIINSIKSYKTYICTEILATGLEFGVGNEGVSEIEIDEQRVKVQLFKEN
jgi:isoleucyl-tRNA synthetase